MLYRLRYLIAGLLALVSIWTGLHVYRYFFDRVEPAVIMAGLDDGGCYGSDIQCRVSANKKGYLSVWIDGQPVISNYWLSRHEHEHHFAIPTKTISNGQHSFALELVDTSFHHNKAHVERNFTVDNLPIQAAFVRSENDFKVFQGRTLRLQFQVNKEIKEAKVRTPFGMYDCFPESPSSSVYECYIPVSCEEAPNEYLLNVDIADRVGNKLVLDTKFQIVLYPFKKQTLTVGAEKFEQEKALGQDAAKLQNAMAQLLQQSPHDKLWRGPFVMPIDAPRVTCEFGTIRTTQEKGRYAHKGLDIVNMPKTVVWAPQDGIVVHKERYAFTGNTVVIDHGWGILSLLCHLDNFADITVGQKVAKGNPIGTVGKTGYATGYHLHWEMRVNNVQVDPLQWTRTSF